MLNDDQLKAINFFKQWHKSNNLFAILNGSGGTGKTFLLPFIIKELNSRNPILLAQTHEAINQIREKTNNRYNYRTIYSALGIRPTFKTNELSFEQLNMPPFWDDVDLCLVDEASMISKEVLDLLTKLGVRIIFIGHDIQLPSVDVNRKITDPCISPVFKAPWDKISLTLPMRTSSLEYWDYLKQIENNIRNKKYIIPNTFDIKKQDITNLINSSKGKDLLLEGKLKFVLWTNSGVDNYNIALRDKLFHTKETFVKDDLLILTSPSAVISDFEYINDYGLKQLSKSKTLDFYYTNTKLRVINIKELFMSLNKKLSFPIIKIEAEILSEQNKGSKEFFYVFKNESDRLMVNKYYQHLAFAKSSKQEKEKAFKLAHFIMSCFAEVKHYYAATAHRLQGASVPRVIVINNDIAKNSNIVERFKCLYVGLSRMIEEENCLYRGI